MTTRRCGSIALVCAVLAAASPAIAESQDGSRGPTPIVSKEAPVTLSASNLEITEVLAMFARSRGLNIITSDEVTGTVSIELNEVPFDEALAAVVTTAGYEVTRKGDIYFVHRPAGGDPASAALHDTRTFRLDYAEPAAMLPVIERMLSPNGLATGYPPLRAIVVKDRGIILDQVAEVIRSLDAAPRQVVIEAQILEARLSSDLRFGIDWSLLFGNSDGSGDLVVEGFASPPSSGQGLYVTWGQGDFASSLETVAGVQTLETLARPRLLVVDGANAEIIIGGQLGFPVVTTVENTVIQSIEFLDTGTKLTVTPIIADDGHILLEIHPELSDGVIDEGLPSKTTTQVTSSVLVEDGHTLLIGGLIRERDEKTRRGIPLLVDLPVLGALFGRTTTSVERSELIVLITPRILRQGESVAYRGAGLVTPERMGQ